MKFQNANFPSIDVSIQIIYFNQISIIKSLVFHNNKIQRYIPKNVLHFCTYSPCQVADRLMYHFLLLQWQSISISGKSVTSKGAIEKIITKKHSMIYCNRVVENCEHFQSFTDQRLNDWYHLASNYRAVDSA